MSITSYKGGDFYIYQTTTTRWVANTSSASGASGVSGSCCPSCASGASGYYETVTTTLGSVDKLSCKDVFDLFTRGDLTASEMEKWLNSKNIKYQKAEKDNLITFSFNYENKDYKLSCRKSAAEIQIDGLKTNMYSPDSLKNTYNFDEETIEKYFYAAKEENGVAKYYAIRDEYRQYATPEHIRNEIFTEYKNNLIVQNFLAGKTTGTRSNGEKTEYSNDLYKTDDGTLLTKNNLNEYLSEIGDISDTDKQEAIDKFIADFSRGKLAYSQVSTILEAIGVENKTQKLENGNYVISFTFNNKNYTITCNKEAAVSGIDDKIVKLPEDVMDEFYDDGLYEQYSNLLHSKVEPSVEDCCEFINNLDEFINSNKDNISCSFKTKLENYKTDIMRTMLYQVEISMSESDYEKELADKVLFSGLRDDGSGIDTLRAAGVVFGYDSDIKEFIDKAVSIYESGDKIGFKNFVNTTEGYNAYVSDKLDMIISGELTDESEYLLDSYLGSKYSGSKINVSDVVSEADSCARDFVNSRWVDTDSQRISLYFRFADAFFELAETVKECRIDDIEEILDFAENSMDTANTYSYLSSGDFTEEFFNIVELAKETARYAKSNGFNVVEYTQSRLRDFTDFRRNNPDMPISQMETEIKKQNDSIKSYAAENYPPSFYTGLSDSAWDTIRQTANSYVRYNDVKIDKTETDKDTVFNNALDTCIMLASFAVDSGYDPSNYISENFLSTIEGTRRKVAASAPSDSPSQTQNIGHQVGAFKEGISVEAMYILDGHDLRTFDEAKINKAFSGCEIQYFKKGVFITNGDAHYTIYKNDDNDITGISMSNKEMSVSFDMTGDSDTVLYSQINQEYRKKIKERIKNGDIDEFYDFCAKYGFIDDDYILDFYLDVHSYVKDNVRSDKQLGFVNDVLNNSKLPEYAVDSIYDYVYERTVSLPSFENNVDLESYQIYLAKTLGYDSGSVPESIANIDTNSIPRDVKVELINLVTRSRHEIGSDNNKLDFSLSSVNQGVRGNCYYLQTIISLANTPIGLAYLKSIVDIDNDNKTVSVDIMGMNIEFTFDEIKSTPNYSKMGLTRVLEMAYSRARAIRGVNYEIGNGGNMFRVLEDLFGKSSVYTKTKEDINKIKNSVNNKTALATIAFSKTTDKVHNNHTYAVVRVDDKGIYIKNPWEAGISNPWDDSGEIFLTWGEYYSNTSSLMYANVNNLITPDMLDPRSINMGTYEQIMLTAPEYNETENEYSNLYNDGTSEVAYITDGQYIYDVNSHKCVGFLSVSHEKSADGEDNRVNKYIISGEEVALNNLPEIVVSAKSKTPKSSGSDINNMSNPELAQKCDSNGDGYLDDEEWKLYSTALGYINKGYSTEKSLLCVKYGEKQVKSAISIAKQMNRKDDEGLISRLSSRDPEQLKEIQAAIENGWLSAEMNSGGGDAFTVTNILGLKAAITAGMLSFDEKADAKIASIVSKLFAEKAEAQNSYQYQNQKMLEEDMKRAAQFFASMDARNSYDSYIIQAKEGSLTL